MFASQAGRPEHQQSITGRLIPALAKFRNATYGCQLGGVFRSRRLPPLVSARLFR